MTAFYNEIDPYAAQWLRNLIDAGHIARGDVDERSIVDVRADSAEIWVVVRAGGVSFLSCNEGYPLLPKEGSTPKARGR